MLAPMLRRGNASTVATMCGISPRASSSSDNPSAPGIAARALATTSSLPSSGGRGVLAADAGLVCACSIGCWIGGGAVLALAGADGSGPWREKSTPGMRVKYHHAATATTTITTIAPAILPVAELCRVTTPPKPGTVWIGCSRSRMVPSNQRLYSDEQPVQPEREQRPYDNANHHRADITPGRAGGVLRVLRPITPATRDEIGDRPDQERAEQHHVVQETGRHQVPRRPCRDARRHRVGQPRAEMIG